MALFAVKDILPNPFRHIARYPIQPHKVAALRESLRATGFWGNIVARERAGKAEIAYGHHRLVALKEEYGPNFKADLIIRTLTDEVMLQMMARENMEEWGTTASVEHETIRAVVEAFAEGKIRLPAIPANISEAQRRYAPSFVPRGRDQQAGRAPYTAQAVAEFIGWLEPGGKAQAKVTDALAALQFVEEGLLKEKDFEGLTTMQAHAVVEETRKARAHQEAVSRLHRQQAEQAEREAKAAERRREQAEQERRRQAAQAAAARDADKKSRALEEAKRSERERREAEEARKRAVQRQQKEKEKERVSVEKGRERATTVGRAVSAGIKSGEIGYKRAGEVASRADIKRPAGPPPYIEGYARKLASELNTILDPDRDARATRLLEVIKHREYLNDLSRADLARTLENVANRALGHAKQLSGAADRRSLPTKR
jgi:flagellar biosynthesis GTPase FlhF